MKTICFLNSTKFWGGGEKLCFENAVEFRKLGYVVHIAARKGSPLFTKAARGGFAVFPISVSNRSLLNPVKHIRLIRFFKANGIDTLFVTTSQDMKLGGIAAKIAGLRRIVYLRGLASPVGNTPLNRFLFTKVLTHRIANSLETRATMLRNLGNVIATDAVRVIYHGIDLESADDAAFMQPPPAFEHEGEVIIGNAGRLTPQKGHHLLIEAARALKAKGLRFKLLIAGEGELRDRLRSLIDGYGLSREVVLLGFVKDIEGFMNRIDIFALSSIWEGFGYALVEAMARGKPVVAFDCSSNPEIVEHGKNGYLAPYPDGEAFAGALARLIGDRELRAALGKNGRAGVEARFRLRDRVKELEAYCLSAPGPA